MGRDAGSKYAVTRLRISEHAKAGLKSFPTAYNMPIWSNIGLSYTVGKLLNSAFEQHKRHLCTPMYFLSASLMGASSTAQNRDHISTYVAVQSKG